MLRRVIGALLLIAAIMGPAIHLDAAARKSSPRHSGTAAQALSFHNPLEMGADPCLFWYKGWYYLSTTKAVDVSLRRARRLGELRTARDQVVWQDPMTARFHDVWAAEFHLLDTGDRPRWFLYYTSDNGKNDASHRIYVAQSAGTDPMGPYTFVAQLQTDPEDQFYAIDPTVLKLPDGSLYLFWCGRPSPAGQGLYVSRMKNPWTLTGTRTYLPASGFGCPSVREGPELLQHSGKLFLVYSMCGASTPDYRLGMLYADVKSDLLNPASWKQYPRIVFARVDQYGVYGPGHCYFFKSPDRTQDWIAYHAKSGSADTYADRSTRAQRFTWSPDGIPDFGLPLPLDRTLAPPSGEPPLPAAAQ
ncbi:MAG TPA: glycoside hydrolase family 43 protein [Armatimonadota bacterium]|nr:glycoside hydrolase family 43 protein [Armatimonadota bacterium]